MVAIAIVLAATFVLAVGSVFGVYPAYHHHKVAQHHRATLANIDRLERELGIGDYFDETFNREIAPLVAQDGDKLSPDVEPAARIYGSCALCKRHVALNAGRCQLTYFDRRNSQCAKEVWLREKR